ncbi:MAG: von Willebrand factor type A domain-containing protein [Bacteroidetes bacterium]|uniref:vWA domain-containing protein n=1 Tax=Flavobacterium sp. TaxID=239 RepID=UPI002FD8D398|nr:von Willebrand factor type A domain-containing protein [Bacteroidota bacterium]
MKKFKPFSTVLAMLICFVSLAQQKTITGVVSDALGPLAGANVVVKNTTRNTQTDFDGKYSIKATKGEILVFSYVGYTSKAVKVGNSTTINVKLESAQTLQEVVVVSYDDKKESEYDSYIGKAVMDTKARSMVSQQVQGYAKGLSISQSNTNAIVIRGSRSVTGTTDIIPATNDYEDYEAFAENVFESPKASPLSTFSIDVDNASYTNIRRFINNGQKVPKDAVRIEEMMNFFKYKYPQPTNEHPFSINSEYSDCPWNTNNKLVRIGLQGKNIDDSKLPASNLVFLIDVSGSMFAANKLPLLKESLKVLVNQLRKDDRVAIVVYAGAAGLVLPPTSGDKKMTIIDALEKLQSGGSTAGGAGIQLAYQTAKEHFIKGGNNRVVLATDGDFNVGASSDNDMQRLIEEERKSGVFLTSLGFGMGNYKDSKMETLANKGNGNYAYIDNIQEANRFLGKEFKGSMFAIAKDVKIQIEFNPTFVQAYRLIGYENRKLRPEDFKNDEIDAGELGSGHTVTALYEIVPVNVKSDYFKPIEDTKYSKVENKGVNYQNELATIKFRYKKPNGDKSIEMVSTIASASKSLNTASDDYKFTAAVAWFGLNLRDSKLVSNKSLVAIKKLAKEGLANDDEGYKAEFIRLIDGGNTFIASKN